MHYIWRREKEFVDFLEKQVVEGGIYTAVAVVESFFELMTMALLRKLGSARKPRQKTAITKLFSTTGKMPDREAEAIFNEVRELRNDMLHNVLYQPDINRLKDFMQKCFGERLETAEEIRCGESEEQLERIFRHKITTAYAQIVGKYKKEVDMKISDYIKTL